jgi:hypothetical protein
MDIYIACAGSATRWKNYMNVPKHLVTIENERLLDRTVKKCKECFPNATIYITYSDEITKDMYRVEGTSLVKIQTDVTSEPALCSLLPYYNVEKDVLVLLGDVYFSENAFRIISECNEKNKVTVYGRKRQNIKTGCKAGELFAFWIPKMEQDKFKECISQTQLLFKEKYIDRFLSWEIISLWFSNVNDMKQCFELRRYPNKWFTEIIDETEDFDFPEDFDKWNKYRFEPVKIEGKTTIPLHMHKFYRR